MMAGAAAASSGIGRRGDELGPAFEAEGRYFLGHFAAVTLGALDFGLAVKNDLLKILVAFGTMVFVDRHTETPFLIL